MEMKTADQIQKEINARAVNLLTPFGLSDNEALVNRVSTELVMTLSEGFEAAKTIHDQVYKSGA